MGDVLDFGKHRASRAGATAVLPPAYSSQKQANDVPPASALVLSCPCYSTTFELLGGGAVVCTRCGRAAPVSWHASCQLPLGT